MDIIAVPSEILAEDINALLEQKVEFL
jgi:hypothetical protein